MAKTRWFWQEQGMNKEPVLCKPKLLRSRTTLDPAEFERLSLAFDTAWQR